MSSGDGPGFVQAAREFLARAAALPLGTERCAAERFVAMARDWLDTAARTGSVDPVGYARLVEHLDDFPAC